MSYYTGPCYSNIDTIKRAMINEERPMSFNQIVLYVQTNWSGGKGTTEEFAREMVESALNAPSSKFELIEGDMWRYKEDSKDKMQQSLINVAIRHLEQVKNPVLNRDMILHITKALGYPRWTIEGNIRVLNSDLRLSNISNYWLLSKWELTNDLAYNYLCEKGITETSIKELEETLRCLFNLSANAVFAPIIDQRFKVARDGTGKITILSNTTNQVKEQEIIIPNALVNIVQSKLPDILEIIKSSSDLVTTASIISNFFNVTREQTSYGIYEKALIEALSQVPLITQESDGSWKYSHIPADTFIKKVNTPRIRNSVVLESDVLNKSIEPYEEKSWVSNVRTSGSDSLNAYRTTIAILSRHLQSGQIPVSAALKKILGIPEGAEYICKINAITYDQMKYTWLYDPTKNHLYAVSDFFNSQNITPGTILSFMKSNEDYTVDVRIVGVNEVIAKEQARYENIDLLREQANQSGKSYFAIICELLSQHLDSGLHYKELVAQVSLERQTGINTIVSILSRNDCFYQKHQGDGIWYLDPEKLKSIQRDVSISRKDVTIEENYTRTPILNHEAALEQSSFNDQFYQNEITIEGADKTATSEKAIIAPFPNNEEAIFGGLPGNLHDQINEGITMISVTEEILQIKEDFQNLISNLQRFESVLMDHTIPMLSKGRYAEQLITAVNTIKHLQDNMKQLQTIEDNWEISVINQKEQYIRIDETLRGKE